MSCSSLARWRASVADWGDGADADKRIDFKVSGGIYSVSQKKSPWGFVAFSPNYWEFFYQILHDY